MIISGGWDSNVFFNKNRFLYGILELKNQLEIFMVLVFLEIQLISKIILY